MLYVHQILSFTLLLLNIFGLYMNLRILNACTYFHMQNHGDYESLNERLYLIEEKMCRDKSQNKENK